MTPAELKSIREELNLPGQWLADRMGISITRLYAFESSRRTLPVADQYVDTVTALQVAWREARDRLLRELDAAAPDAPVLRYDGSMEFDFMVPELAGWPLSAQGPLLRSVARELGRRVAYAS